jgi:hypothetical protein
MELCLVPVVFHTVGSQIAWRCYGRSRMYPLLAGIGSRGVADERDGAGASARALVRSAGRYVFCGHRAFLLGCCISPGCYLLVAGLENTGIWQ